MSEPEVPNVSNSATPPTAAPPAAESGDAQQTLRVEERATRRGSTLSDFISRLGLKGGVAIEAAPPRPAPHTESGDAQGRYAIGGVLGAGGMGTVLKARDVNLHRWVAMKIVRQPGQDLQAQVLRFIEEAQVTGQLDHPNIVPVYELGVDSDDSVFYTMKLVSGVTLHQILQELRAGQAATVDRYPLSRLLGIFLKACDAVAFAHSKGVIHRDLKPQNIMVGGYGEVLVLDWGLAKVLPADSGAAAAAPPPPGAGGTPEAPVISSVRTDSTNDTHQTLEGQVLGTPVFMAPEQAAGKVNEIDIRTDIYALGAILYNILTLCPPVAGRNVGEILFRVAHGQIVPPTARAGTARGNGLLSTAVGAPCQHAGTDTGQNEPAVLPHCPNNRVPEALAAVAMKALALKPESRYPNVKELQADVERYLSGFATLAENASLGRQLTLLVRRHKGFVAAAATVVATLATGLVVSTVLWRQAVTARAAEARQRARAEAARDAEATARHSLERENYVNTIGWAEARIGEGIMNQAEAMLWRTPASRRHWEWGYLLRRCHPELLSLPLDAPVLAVDFSPDGKRFLACRARNATVFALATGEELCTLKGHAGTVSAARFFPDSRRVVTTGYDRTAKVWDLADNREILAYTQHQTPITALALSPDGARAATLDGSGTIRVWDTNTGQTVSTLAGRAGQKAACLAFAGDSTRLVGAGPDQRLRLWNVLSGKPIGEAFSALDVVAVSPDGTRVAGCITPHGIAILALPTGERLAVLKGHRAPIHSLRFSADGSRLLSTSYDRTARIWDTRSGAELATLTGHGNKVWTVACSPDGRLVLTGSEDRSAKLWDAAATPVPGLRRLPLKNTGSLAVSPDNTLLLNGRSEGFAQLWDLRAGRHLADFTGHTKTVWSVCFAPDGRSALTASVDGTARVWSIDTRQERLCLRGHRAGLRAAVFSPNGQHIATASHDQTAKVWDSATGTEQHTLIGHSALLSALVFSPDGQRIATGSADHTVRIWDAATGHALRCLRQTGLVYPHSLAFSPDGRLLAAGGGEGNIWLFDERQGTLGRRLTGHAGRVTSLSFSPDGRRLLSACEDMTAKLWDPQTGDEILNLPEENGLSAALFTPAGRDALFCGRFPHVIVRTAFPWDITPEGVAQTQREHYMHRVAPHP